MVDSSFDYLVALQNSTRSTALQRASYINEYIKAPIVANKIKSINIKIIIAPIILFVLFKIILFIELM